MHDSSFFCNRKEEIYSRGKNLTILFFLFEGFMKSSKYQTLQIFIMSEKIMFPNLETVYDNGKELHVLCL